MPLFSRLTMLFIGALVIVTTLGDVDAFGVGRKGTTGEELPEISSSKPTTTPKVVNRGKIKFQMTKSFAFFSAAVKPVARNGLNRVRKTENVNLIEKDLFLEAKKVKATTPKVISTTPSSILIDILNQDDSLEIIPAVAPKSNVDPILVRRVLPVNRLNRFRTTTVPTPLTQDSIRQDDAFVLISKAVNKPAVTKNRFSRIRTTTAPNSVSRDSKELNDVSLEVVQVRPTPVLHRGRTASRGKNLKVMNISRLNRTQATATTKIGTSNHADSKEIDLSLEDFALTILPTAQAPAGTTTETPTTDGKVTIPLAVLISKQSDEKINLSTEIDDLLTTKEITITTEESEEVTASPIPVTISMQSDEWHGLFDDVVILQTTTPAPTTTPLVSRSQSKGRGKFLQATNSATKENSKVNRIRTTMAPKISRDSDEQKDIIIIMSVTSSTTSAPVSKNRFSRVRTTTVRAPTASQDSQKQVPAPPTTTTTMRNTLVGNRFSRFRTAATTTTAVPAIAKVVEKESASAPKRVPPKKSLFGNVRTSAIRLKLSGDSGEKETILLGDIVKVNQPNNVETTTAVRNPPTLTMGRLNRVRTTATAKPIASRHSGEENISVEDLVFKINRPTEQMVKNSTDAAIVAGVSLMPITRHSDEQQDHVSLEQVDKVVVPVAGGLAVVDMDVSDEILGLPETTTLDSISSETFLVIDDGILSAVSPVAVTVDLTDSISDEIIPVLVPTTTNINPKSEALTAAMTTKTINRGHLKRRTSQI